MVVDVLSLQPLEVRTIVVIGNFDGVHIGHQELLKKAKFYKKTEKLKIVALTFWPHPASVFGRDRESLLLMPLEERVRLLKLLGVDEVVVLEFSEALFSMSPEKFLNEVMVGKLRAGIVIVGEDFRFGKDRSGDVNFMKNYLAKFGVYVEIVKHVYHEGMPVSSTRIRRLVKEGRVEEVWHLLGRPYKLLGTVIKGASRGMVLGFPTANVIPENKVVPADGVYATFVDLGFAIYRGVTNVGKNPTFGGGIRSVETHILDFSGNLYGSKIGIFFVRRLREERKFATIDDLRKAIEKDVMEGRGWLEWERLAFGLF